MIVINLLPQEERVEERVLTARPRVKFLLPLAAIVALIVPPVATTLLQTTRIDALTRDLALVDQEAQSLQPRLEMIRQIQATRAQLAGQLDVIRGLNRDRTLPVRLMDQLAAQIPANLWLTRVRQVGASGVELDGVTFSNLVVADLMNRLEETSLYENVSLTVASREQLGEAHVTKFTLTSGISAQR